ncbi:MAG: ABC transporter permease subunit, partial [Acetobacteraceae bacterium]
MMQILANGVLSGAVLAVAALGLSLTYAVFRFPNFGHAEYLTAAAYGAVTGYALVAPGGGDALGIVVAGAFAAAFAMLVVMAAARLVFARLIARGGAGVLIIGSFAVGLLVRSLVALLFGVNERTPDRDLEIAMPLGAGVRATPTEIAIVLLSGVLILLLHLVLSRTTLGKTLRAVAENPLLAGIAGISVAHVRRAA